MKVLIGIALCLFGVAHAMYSASDDVVELTASNFNKLVLGGDEVWFVEFYAPWCGHCQSLAPEWKKAATALKGVAKVGAVDMTVHQSVGSPYGIQGFPTIKVFGLNKNKPTDYNGARSGSGIVDAAMSAVRSMVQERQSGKTGGKKSGGNGGGKQRSGGDPADVIELTDSSFEEMVLKSKDIWLVEFFAPWCGHCKNLVPHWQEAATALKGKVKLGTLDATVHTVMSNRYEVRGFPTIKFFHNGDVSEYDGGRTASDIIAWATDKAAENIAPPELNELTAGDVLKGACDDHQLCIISILPHILDCQSECRNSYLKTLKLMGEKYKKKMWGWVWAEAAAQQEVEESLGIGGFGYPAMAAVNARKMKFALLKGPFSETGINEFLRELAVGRGRTEPVKGAKLPKVYTQDPWDGKDGEFPVEEDIDLSDVDLDDEPGKDEL